MFVFPGIGLGALLSRANSITDSMIEASSLGLATALTDDEIASELLYPRIERIREISARVAMKVIRAAQVAVRRSRFNSQLVSHSNSNVSIGCRPRHCSAQQK